MVTATFLFHGFCDYWGGNGSRWDTNKGCLFAFYDRSTTLHDLVNDWVNDFISGGDCDDWPETIGASDVKRALLAMLSDTGRKDYDSGKLIEFARECEADRNVDAELPIAIVLVTYD